jgi:hypothetical protein
MNFRNATAYEGLQNGTPYTFKGSNGALVSISTKHIPTGSTLYRQDREPNPRFGTYPEYLGNYNFVTSTYSSNKTNNHLTAYVTRKPLNLVSWTLENIWNLVHHPKANPELLAYYLEHDNAVQPLGYLPGTDEETDRHAYVNRLMSEMICGFGMDGWIVKPKSLRWHIWGREEDYAPEVVLCPSVFKGGRRTRRGRASARAFRTPKKLLRTRCGK